MSEVVNLNHLEKRGNGVFGFPGQDEKDFGYSDGQQVEQYLHRVFSESTDLSSRSRQLQTSIMDWPSEYHLSSDRANLLRGYDLSFVRTALEFGSGCGSISRYLGEQGIAVDAIEGSPSRAELGKMRCRDLENVTVINANYNELQLPQQHYDLVLFIGVIEYARKFHPQADSDQEAVVAILNQVRGLLSEQGVVMIAIENRLGLKYILGHHEDHYAKRYVGIHGYGNSAGIATYSDIEWREIVNESGFETCVFSYPFPDYKIPQVTLGEDYVRNDTNAFNHLEGVFARDYTQPAKRSPTESIAWQAAGAGKFLHSIANSYCLVIGNNPDTVNQTMCFDFCHMPGPGRKNEYAVMTRKLRNQNTVNKIPLQTTHKKNRSGLRQVLGDQPYLSGNLLSTEWLRAILIYTRRDEFDELLAEYYAYLCDMEKSGEPLMIDMLPINIVVDEGGSFQIFDQEWEVDWKITKEYLLFRALLTFVVTNWIHLKEFLGWLELNTVREFVNYGFSTRKLLLAKHIDKFCEIENTFQRLIANDAPDCSVEQLLETTFDFSSEHRSIYAVLLWYENDEKFDESKSTSIEFEPSPEQQLLEFVLPETVEQVAALRIDPFDIRKTEKAGFFSLSKISLIEKSETRENVCWELRGEKKIASACEAESTWFTPLAETGYWLSSTDFPKLVFPLEKVATRSQGAHFIVRVEIRITETLEYILAHQRYLVKMRQAEHQKQDLEELTETNYHLSHDLESAKSEISNIKSGKPFRIAMKIMTLLNFFKR